MSHPDFIEVYEDIVDVGACRAIIERFEKSPLVTRGQTGGGLDTTLKDSWDIGISRNPEWLEVERGINRAVLQGVMRYLRKYAHALIGPLQFKIADTPGGKGRPVTPEDLAAMDDQTLVGLVVKAFRPGDVNLQKYLADVGGYPYWHSELYPKLNDGGETLHRVILWTVYLNDSFEEGETEFLYQNRKIKPKTGSLLIAPTAFTHTHRGNRPRGGDKYIATSWILFQKAEWIYAQ